MGRLGGHAFYKAKGTKDPSRRKPARKHRRVYLTDICTCGHERHVHMLKVDPFMGPPNFGRWACSRCTTCPMFVMDVAYTEANKEMFPETDACTRQALARKP